MTTTQKVNFKSKGINIVGNLYLPADFDPSQTYEGIVMTPPFPQVKDQVLGNYGPKMAERGYVALSFDYNSKGESDSYQQGFRDDDDMPRKWEDLRNAISFLGSLPYVGAINGLAFCGGSDKLKQLGATFLLENATNARAQQSTLELFLDQK